MSCRRMKCAVLQMDSGEDTRANLEQFRSMVEEAAENGARLISTPECTFYIGPDKAAHTEEEGESEGLCLASALARKYGLALHVGSVYTGAEGPRCFNESFLFAPDGSVCGRYRKLHCFDVSVGGKEYRESRRIEAGSTIETAELTLADQNLSVGFSICYDLRFPEHYRLLRQKGARVLLVPSCFTKKSGERHWDTLLRARAIDQAAFLLAAAQCGQKYNMTAYGHAAIFSPGGEKLAEAGTEPAILYAALDLSLADEEEKAFGSLHNRRTDVYDLRECNKAGFNRKDTL